MVKLNMLPIIRACLQENNRKKLINDLIKELNQSFFVVRFRKVSSALAVIMLVLTIAAPIASGTASAANTGNITNEGFWVYFFYGDGCPHCAIVEPLIENLTAKYPQVKIFKLETWYNSSNKALFQDFSARYEVKYPAVPAVFIADQALVREEPIQTSLESNILHIISTNNTISPLRYSVAEASAIKNAHPEMEFITADGIVFNSSQAVISWNYTKAQSNVAVLEASIDGGSFENISGDAKTFIADGLTNGNHTFVLRITDLKGLSSNHSLNFTVELISQESSNQLFSSPLAIGFAVFILIVGLSLVFVRRSRKK